MTDARYSLWQMRDFGRDLGACSRAIEELQEQPARWIVKAHRRVKKRRNKWTRANLQPRDWARDRPLGDGFDVTRLMAIQFNQPRARA